MWCDSTPGATVDGSNTNLMMSYHKYEIDRGGRNVFVLSNYSIKIYINAQWKIISNARNRGFQAKKNHILNYKCLIK